MTAGLAIAALVALALAWDIRRVKRRALRALNEEGAASVRADRRRDQDHGRP
jgi:hypothetical protein